jgi:hypothetical protein
MERQAAEMVHGAVVEERLHVQIAGPLDIARHVAAIVDPGGITFVLARATAVQGAEIGDCVSLCL